MKNSSILVGNLLRIKNIFEQLDKLSKAAYPLNHVTKLHHASLSKIKTNKYQLKNSVKVKQSIVSFDKIKIFKRKNCLFRIKVRKNP